MDVLVYRGFHRAGLLVLGICARADNRSNGSSLRSQWFRRSGLAAPVRSRVGLRALLVHPAGGPADVHGTLPTEEGQARQDVKEK